MKKQDDKKEQAIILAEKVRLLFGFYADLIPDKDLVNEVTGSWTLKVAGVPRTWEAL